MAIPNQTTEYIFTALCTGGSPLDDHIRQFCREASDEQLRTVLSKATPANVRRLDLVENELEARRHKEMTGHLGNVTSGLKDATAKIEELKKPHPLLWWTFAAAWIGVIGTYLQLWHSYAPAPDANRFPIAGHTITPDQPTVTKSVDLQTQAALTLPTPTTNAATTLPQAQAKPADASTPKPSQSGGTPTTK